MAQSTSSVEVGHEITSMVILIPSASLRGVVVSFKQKCVQDILVNCLGNLS